MLNFDDDTSRMLKAIAPKEEITDILIIALQHEDRLLTSHCLAECMQRGAVIETFQLPFPQGTIDEVTPPVTAKSSSEASDFGTWLTEFFSALTGAMPEDKDRLALMGDAFYLHTKAERDKIFSAIGDALKNSPPKRDFTTDPLTGSYRDSPYYVDLAYDLYDDSDPLFYRRIIKEFFGKHPELPSIIPERFKAYRITKPGALNEELVDYLVEILSDQRNYPDLS